MTALINNTNLLPLSILHQSQSSPVSSLFHTITKDPFRLKKNLSSLCNCVCVFFYVWIEITCRRLFGLILFDWFGNLFLLDAAVIIGAYLQTCWFVPWGREYGRRYGERKWRTKWGKHDDHESRKTTTTCDAWHNFCTHDVSFVYSGFFIDAEHACVSTMCATAKRIHVIPLAHTYSVSTYVQPVVSVIDIVVVVVVVIDFWKSCACVAYSVTCCVLWFACIATSGHAFIAVNSFVLSCCSELFFAASCASAATPIAASTADAATTAAVATNVASCDSVSVPGFCSSSTFARTSWSSSWKRSTVFVFCDVQCVNQSCYTVSIPT